MKNKLGAIIISTIGAFALYGNVEAATLAIGSDSTTAGALNKSVSVELKDDDLKDFAKVEFQLSIDGTSYASIDSYSHKITSLGFKSEGGIYKIGNEDNSGELFATTVGSISYKTTSNLNSNFKITPTNVKFYKKDGTVLQNGDAGIKVQAGTITFEKEKSKDASLTNLVVSQGTLTPAFDKDTTEYTVAIKDTISYIKVTPTAAPGATVTGGGTKSLQIGENTVELIVTAEDGNTKKTYKINVIRGEIADPSAYLKSLTINNIGVALSPEFDSKNNTYTVKASTDIESLNLKYETEDPLAEVTVEGNEDFKLGENEITITVVSSDKEKTETYKIKVLIEEEESTDIPIAPIEKEEKKSGPKWWLIALIVSIILIVIAGISFILFKNKKNKKQESKTQNVPLKRRDLPEDNEETLTRTEKYREVSDERDMVSDNDIEQDTGERELFEDEKTRRYDSNLIKEFRFEDEDEEGEYDDRTKEFNFRNLE
ncbi:MAG TPA: hypothetical protein DCY94_00895 [Firmicutes bacterium]|nr:hypothetical protein [Bacillota bacterium]